MSALFAELSGPVGMGRRLDPEDLRQVLGEALAGLIAEVEGLGGTVTSVSGAGLAALFGAPQAHEDDPERAVRAGGRILSTTGSDGHSARPGALSVRVGIETGPAVVGPLGAGTAYGAVGEVVGAAAAVQSAAKAGSVLVGPVTRAATEGVFEWGPTEEVAPNPGVPPLIASYLERPKATTPSARSASIAGWQGRLPLGGRARPSWPCSKTPCEELFQGQARSSSSWASPAWVRPAWCRNAASASWPGWAPALAGCRYGWKAGLPPYASSSPLWSLQAAPVRLGSAPPPKREPGEVVRPHLRAGYEGVFGGQVPATQAVLAPHDGPTARQSPRLARKRASAPRGSRERLSPALTPSWREWSRGARPCSSWRTCTGPTQYRSGSPSNLRH